MEIACLEHELSNVVPNNARMLDVSITYGLISRKQYPLVLPHKREPHMIGRAAGKMCEVSFVFNAVLLEGF